jgi:hypothetical protein
MSDGAHLLIPFASSHAAGCVEARATLALPRLEKLLSRLERTTADAGEENSLSMPHERVLARECGLAAPDGLIPWAAWQVHRAGGDPAQAAWALITPCHWRVGSDHVAMDDPQHLQLEESEARALFAAMQPYFEEDAIVLTYDTPDRWLARGDMFRELATASLDRVVGRAVDSWLPRVPRAGALRRLQQEMQMLLYTNDVNEERLARGLLPVNSFWISGTGALPTGHPAAPPPGLTVTDALRQPALQGDWATWAAAWRQVDESDCARLLDALDAGQPVSLTLGGERSAHTWSSQSGGWWRRIGSAFSGKQAMAVLEAL